MNTKSLWTRWTRSRIPAHSFFQSLERLGERHRTIQTLKYLESISFISGKLYSRNAVENCRNEFVVILVQRAKFLEFEIAIIRSLKRRTLCQPGTLEGVTASAGVGATLSAPFRSNCQDLRYTSVPVTTSLQKGYVPETVTVIVTSTKSGIKGIMLRILNLSVIGRSTGKSTRFV